MSMFFHFGVQESAILFKFWSISTLSGLLLSMGLIFLASISHEGIKFYRNRLEKSRRAKYLTVGGAEAGGPKPPSSDTIAQIIPSDVRTVNPRVSRLSLEHILATLVYGIQVTLSLCLMLVFMTYNVWLCLAMVLGSCVGYFFFNDGSPADAEFCH
ncbi:copper uptake protein [Nesidiocoris tenuis]|uniref:Copper transport protein n=1 Tax=Nesidiocoris tenuis TaxID=355587 RepID=A0ABN7ANH5_9HEMI|nr:copper uptake protein [Nesidiocoris tenuis]